MKFAAITALALLTPLIALAAETTRQISLDNVSAKCWPPYGGCIFSEPGNWMSVKCPVVGSEADIALRQQISECETKLQVVADPQR